MRKQWYILWLLIAGFIMPAAPGYAHGSGGNCCRKKEHRVTTTHQATASHTTAHGCKCTHCKHNGCNCQAPCNSTVSLLPAVIFHFPPVITFRKIRWHYNAALPPSVYLSSKLPPKLA